MRENSRNKLLKHLELLKHLDSNKKGFYNPGPCLKLISEIFKDYLKNDKLREIVKNKRDEIDGKSTGIKAVHKVKKIFGNFSEANAMEIENSSLKAVIEINDAYSGGKI